MASNFLRRVDLIFDQDCNFKEVLKSAYQHSNDEIINQLLESGLKGRGGAGFPTALKWKFTSEQADPEKYVVCNADEGEPGTFKDREILFKVPLKVFGGMAICAKVINAKEGFIYLRGEYRFLLSELENQLQLFNEILKDLKIDFKIRIIVGSGAYICGEETALLNSLEGRKGEPRNKPPFPAAAGLYACPTTINNVETIAVVPTILRRGGAWFAGIGRNEKNTGTKLFCIGGHVN
ncbi:MAG TPA: NADH-quinone oxidoreductase subunit L, partial [Tenuifilaceae bacterium]|nr:NADH-quinone oxidoreductase subunit L [Tenuifilaceae bacterium]